MLRTKVLTAASVGLGLAHSTQEERPKWMGTNSKRCNVSVGLGIAHFTQEERPTWTGDDDDDFFCARVQNHTWTT